MCIMDKIDMEKELNKVEQTGVKALKIVRQIMGILCFTSIILAGAENPDGSVNVGWTRLWIAVAFIAASFYKKLEGTK